MSNFNCAKFLLYFCSPSREEIPICMYVFGEDTFFVIVSLVVMVIYFHLVLRCAYAKHINNIINALFSFMKPLYKQSVSVLISFQGL